MRTGRPSGSAYVIKKLFCVILSQVYTISTEGSWTPEVFELATGDSVVKPSASTRNLSVAFEAIARFLLKSASAAAFQVRSLTNVRDYLPQNLTSRVYTSLVFRRIDYCNALRAAFLNLLSDLFNLLRTWQRALRLKPAARATSYPSFNGLIGCQLKNASRKKFWNHF